MILRRLHAHAVKALESVPLVAILGPRQCGKPTLAIAIADGLGRDRQLYPDLERPADLARLQGPEAPSRAV